MMDGLCKFISLQIHLFIQGAFQGPLGSSRPALFLLPVNRCRRQAQSLGPRGAPKVSHPLFKGYRAAQNDIWTKQRCLL